LKAIKSPVAACTPALRAADTPRLRGWSTIFTRGANWSRWLRWAGSEQSSTTMTSSGARVWANIDARHSSMKRARL
jgi:hypothetical protein